MRWGLRPFVLRGFASLVVVSLLASQVLADLPPPTGRVPLVAHVPRAAAELASLAPLPGGDAESITLTVVLNRDDQAGFDRHLHALYDPQSPGFRHFRSPRKVTARFGPSPHAYRDVLKFLRRYGFTLAAGSRNRMTLTVRGTRAQAERAFGVHLRDVAVDGRRAFLNDVDPGLPAAIAPHVRAVLGLSSIAKPGPSTITEAAVVETIAGGGILGGFVVLATEFLRQFVVVPIMNALPPLPQLPQVPNLFGWLYQVLYNLANVIPQVSSTSAAGRSIAVARGVSGVGQKVGVVAFSGFQSSDVADYLALVGSPPELLAQVSQVAVNGSAARTADQTDVLLAIETVLGLAPGAQVAVYVAPFTGAGTSFQAVFNAMIDDGVSVISNGFGYCEDQTTLADVQSLDAILATAAASGISVFNATGDRGSTCRNGSPNTVMVPADSPNATAVGGTTPVIGPGRTYGGESWWDASARVPPSGQGGFGVSQLFDRPAYQDGVVGGGKRSIPDVVAAADEFFVGVPVCAADVGGCSTTHLYGGTSLSTPAWAAMAAVLNEALGHRLGFLNPTLYPLSGSAGFHSAASMGSDTAHVGLGSPNFDRLLLALGGMTPGPATSTDSTVEGAAAMANDPFDGRIPADGSTTASIIVHLVDANGHSVSGRTVTLAASPGSDAVITPASGVTTVDNGSVVFTVKDGTVEDVTFTATDTTDGVVVTDTATVSFVSLPAALASIGANPLAAAADGMDVSIITVTLQDASHQPTPGKVVRLAQSGHAIITPVDGLTDAAGQIQFTATDIVNETVTFTATDATDGDLPVPGNAQVTFSGSTGTCTLAPPTGLNGYAVTPFASGFPFGVLSYGNVNYGGCSGVLAPAFQGANAFFTDFLNGDLYELPAAGGMATPGDRLSTLGPTLGWPVIGLDGHLYATRASTVSNDFTTGVVVELDRTTGAVVRTLASGLTCPQSLVVDPLSGDLFVDGECFGAGSDDPVVHRVRNPSSVSPTLEAYATLPNTPNGQMVFAPSGSLYVVSGYTQPQAPVVRVSGTNGPTPPTVTTLPGVVSNYWLNIADVGTDGEPRLLITLLNGKLQLTDITVDPPATAAEMATNIGGGTIGPDGCLYMPNSNVVYRLLDPRGGCNYANPVIALTPATVTPDPFQGGSQSFTAKILNQTVPAGTTITLGVVGANPGMFLARTDVAGQTTFTYTGAHTGMDQVVATATIGGQVFVSNRVDVDWAAGKHATALGLNTSPTNARTGAAVGVVAALVDVSAIPAAPVANATIQFGLGSGACSAQTDANGIATCQVGVAAGSSTLTADFAGTAALIESSASVGFTVVGAPCVPLDCADDDPCTTDACNDGTCTHTAPAGFDGATCYIGAATSALNAASTTDVNGRTRKQLLKKLGKIGKQVEKARAGGKRGKKALKKSKALLGKLGKKLGKLRGKKVMPPLADRLIQFVDGAKTALGQVG